MSNLIMFNVFKKFGYKNKHRNESIYIREAKFPENAAEGTFEDYMNQVEMDFSLFNFRPIPFMITGFLQCDNLWDVCKSLTSESCPILEHFLDGESISLKKNTFSIVGTRSMFPNKQVATRCFQRMMCNSSPYIQIDPKFDGVIPQEVFIHEKSVKVLSFSEQKKSEIVRFQVQFDMDVKLLNKVKAIDIAKLKKPTSCPTTEKFYNLARTLNNNQGKIYFMSDLPLLIYQNESEEESDETFRFEFKHYLSKHLLWDYIRILYSFLPSKEWREKLSFWKDPTQFDFSSLNQRGYAYNYVVPQRSCLNTVSMHMNLRVEKNLVEVLDEICNTIERNTMQMIAARRSFFTSVGNFLFTAQIRDVRTIQALQEHCFTVYNAVRSLRDYFVEFMPAEMNPILYLENFVLEQIKCNPLEYMDDENPIVKKMATAWINGSFYGE